MRGVLICFTGIDGAGKTTLSKALVEVLKKRGINCKYVYGRFQPFISKPLILIGKKLFLKESNVFNDYNTYLNKKRLIIKKFKFLFLIYWCIILLDYCLQLIFKIRIPLILGKIIICDRYVYDTVINDFAIDMNYSIDKVKSLIKKLLHIAPKPTLTFLIDVPEEIAFHRKDDIPSIELLKEIRKIYLEVGKEERMIFLDGNKPKFEIQQDIVKIVWRLLR